jgi:3-oxo-5-alpha-steroid 4-dehydrogenase 1
MNESTFFHYLLIGWFILAAVIFIVLFFIVAPYGRHITRNWGLTVKSKFGWIIMESTAPIIFAVCFLLGANRASITGLVFLVLWEMHYIHRAYIYPFSIRGGDKPMPLAIVSLGFFFNAVNGYVNGRYIFTLSNGYPAVWLEDPRLIVGVIIFISGFVINRHSDLILSSLRHPGSVRLPNCQLRTFSLGVLPQLPG